MLPVLRPKSKNKVPQNKNGVSSVDVERNRRVVRVYSAIGIHRVRTVERPRTARIRFENDCTVPDDGPVAVDDALAILAKFSGEPRAMRKTRTELEPSLMDFRVAITDILQSLRAFSGLPNLWLSCHHVAGSGKLCFGGQRTLQSCDSDLDCRISLCP